MASNAIPVATATSSVKSRPRRCEDLLESQARMYEAQTRTYQAMIRRLQTNYQALAISALTTIAGLVALKLLHA